MRRQWIFAVGRICRIRGWFFAILFLAAGEGLFAAPVGSERAMQMVQGWLLWDPKPMEAQLGVQIAGVQTFVNAAGDPVYFVVDLEPTGYVIVPADDEAEPVIAFVERGRYDPSPTNPMGALIGRDLPNRVAETRRMAGIPAPPDAEGQTDFRGRARQRWALLEGAAELPAPPEATGESGLIEPPKSSSVSDVRIAPLVQSRWNQTSAGGGYCYNYYTPNHWPVGCVATAMAQLIRYHQYPASYTPPGGTPRSFNWANMPLVPGYGITSAQREEIGYLCFQVAESVGMKYAADGSSAKLSDASRELELRESFGYSQSIYGKNGWPFSSTNLAIDTLIKMLNPNLDAGLPTLLAILHSGADYGHAIVCDGYGYQSDTLYHHLNMGWSGADDAWYALPNIDGSYSAYDTVYGCAYNIFKSGTGEILSGRTVDTMGRPIAGVLVSTQSGSITSTTTSNGIYALSRLVSNTTYTIAASKAGWSFASKSKKTGTSVDQSNTCGNVWNFLLEGQLSAGTLTLNKTAYTAGETIQIDLLDNDLNSRGTQSVLVQTSSGDRESVILTELTAGKGFFRGTIATIQKPYAVGNGTLDVWQGQTVTAIYQDLNHGNGQAATVTATATVKGAEEVLYATDFETAMDSAWSIVDGGTSTDTWQRTDTPDGYGQGKVMLVDSNAAGNVWMDEELILQLDCRAWQTIRLQFDHHFKRFSVEIGDVEVSIADGPWLGLARYQGDSNNGRVAANLPAAVEGKSDVRIRWHYYNADWDLYWLIDNVRVSGIRRHRPPTVEPLSYFLAKGATQTVELSGTDDGYPSGRMQYRITALPEHGTLSDPDAGVIAKTRLPYALPEGKKQVVYTPRPCFLGMDRFSYAANDFDPTANGGLSEPAEVSLFHPVVMDTKFEIGLPTGWTIVDGYSDGNTWGWEPSGNAGLMVVDSIAAGEVFMDESLVTGVINCSRYRQVRLVFDHNLLVNSDEIADVDIRVDGGGWQNLARYSGGNEYGIADLDASALAAGHRSVQFRWRYYNAWYDWFWAVFRVSIVAGSGAAAGDFEEDCDVDLANFGQLAAAWQSQTGQPAYNPACDLAEPAGIIDLGDLMIFAENWMIRLP